MSKKAKTLPYGQNGRDGSPATAPPIGALSRGSLLDASICLTRIYLDKTTIKELDVEVQNVSAPIENHGVALIERVSSTMAGPRNGH